MKVRFVKITEHNGPEETYILASSVIELIESYQSDLNTFPGPKFRTEKMDGSYGALEQVIIHLKELLPK